jgi:glycosyltransferase involved in cell wall biosynthesis
MRIPTVLEVNAPLAMERSTEPDEKLVFRDLGKWFEREAFRRASGIIAVSSPLRDYIVSLGIDPGKILVLVNGVDEERFTPRGKNTDLMNRYGIPSGKKVIGFSGIFRQWHGIDLLLDAFGTVCRKGCPVHLFLIGDGPIRQWIEARLESEKLKNVCTITGRIPHAEMPDVASLLDIAVSPRATFYASPMKIIEYMALGKAVLAPDTDNIRDIITDGKDGVLFQGENPEAMAEVIVSLLANDAAYERICRGARETVDSRLNWRANARAVTDWMRSRGWNRH